MSPDHAECWQQVSFWMGKWWLLIRSSWSRTLLLLPYEGVVFFLNMPFLFPCLLSAVFLVPWGAYLLVTGIILSDILLSLKKRQIRGEGIVREFALLYLKWITNKDLLYDIGNTAQPYVAAWMGGEFEGEWVHVYVCLSPFAARLKLSQHC